MNFSERHFHITSKADLIDETDGTVIYYGRFNPGQFDYSKPHCQISRLRQDGTVWIKEHANGNELFNNVWSNRTALTYSHLL